MTKELKQEYTLRITQANKTQLITILYDMTLLYLAEAKEALEEDRKEDFKMAIRKIQGCIGELVDSLHMEYDLAKQLFQLYRYAYRELTKASIRHSQENLDHVVSMITKLREAYAQIEGPDVSSPVMGNTQTVYAGLTYGRSELNENLVSPEANRGFSV